MKQLHLAIPDKLPDVTPGTGVWIETGRLLFRCLYNEVTPGTGVWIETRKVRETYYVKHVTPGTGVWIETVAVECVNESSTSLPVRECGLKLLFQVKVMAELIVTPGTGVWIET